MPYAAKRPCRSMGCRNLVDDGYCAEHLDQAPKKIIDRERGTANNRGYNYRWQQERKRFLMFNPLCVQCDADGNVVTATVVDHIIPHRGDQQLFWDRSNWQSLCKLHHDRKTATQDSKFAQSR